VNHRPRAPLLSRALRGRLRRAAPFAALGLLAVAALREAGYLNLSLYRAQQNASFTSTSMVTAVKEGEKSSGPRIISYTGSFTVSVAQEATDGAGRELADHVRRALERRLGAVPVSAELVAGGPVRVEVTRLALSGPYRVPLVKSGTCRFSAVATAGAPGPKEPVRYRGEINGEIERRVSGLYTARQFRRAAAEEAAEQIAKAVAGHVKPKP
jgi:hypothetical protein